MILITKNTILSLIYFPSKYQKLKKGTFFRFFVFQMHLNIEYQVEKSGKLGCTITIEI